MNPQRKGEKCTYKPLEVFGPEHEYSLVDQELNPMPISDQIIKNFKGKTVNFIELPQFAFGKEMQLHVMEIKAKNPFKTPIEFEQTMQKAVVSLSAIVERNGASLLGTGMHPLLRLNRTGIWPHYHRKIYHEYGKIFNLQQHGWLNIQSFHLNLPFRKESDAIKIHNQLCNLCAYLPGIAASSPFFEGRTGQDIDNRLSFYKLNQKEIPSITGDVIPEYVHSLDRYKREVIGRYSIDLKRAGADRVLLNREWVNSRGVIFRFDRRAMELRVLDEQECIKSDVALACFIRATLRGLVHLDYDLLSHELLVNDFNSIIKYGLNAEVSNPLGKTARQVCLYYLDLAFHYADEDEKTFLWLIKRRILEGCLSEVIKSKVLARKARTNLREAIVGVYSDLVKCLFDNEPYF